VSQYSLLEPTYWWVRIHGQVQQEAAACVVCDRIKATFEVKDAALKPLPIMGMFYRWGVDLCKIPTISRHGSKYIVVMVEHFTKWVELRAIPEKTSEYTAAALRDVLCRFGAPAEVLTDQREEFQGVFAEYLAAILADHRETSRNHPQSNGLAERMVQMVKRALRKYCLLYDRLHWDEFLPWIAMGYRMSSHVALGGYSPYFLLFGRHPIVGSSVRDIIAEPINLDDPLMCAAILRERALLFQKLVMPITTIPDERRMKLGRSPSAEFIDNSQKFDTPPDFIVERQNLVRTADPQPSGPNSYRVLARPTGLKSGLNGNGRSVR
jgi:hypothetical protein